MSIEKKLHEWRAAGLLDEASAARIAEFEPGATAQVEWTSCESVIAECDGALRIDWLEQLQRYYSPEDSADQITRRFQDSTREHRARFVVAIDRAGNPQIDSLLVDDEPVERAPEPQAVQP